MDVFQPTFDFLAAHPAWAIALVFGVAMAEALLVIGLFVPSTVVLVSAGALVGAGKLPFWPVMVATIAGCVVGDQVSYWAGRMYGERLAQMWPLRNYPQLLARGEEYVKLHGGKSIAIGRFIPGIKAVVPGIAGMFGMGQGFFFTVNILSGIAWSVLHLAPGLALGQALALAGEMSGKLLLVLLVLLAALAVVGFATRMLAGLFYPYWRSLQDSIAGWAQTRSHPALQRFGNVLHSENPNGPSFSIILAVGVFAFLTSFYLAWSLLLGRTVSNFDQSLFNFFSELRSPPGDEIFIRITMMADEYVLYAVALVPFIWLLVMRRFKTAFSFLFTIATAKLILLGFSFGVSTPGNGAHASDFRFPSDHALIAGTVFGALGMLVARGFANWSRALLVSCFAMAVLAISFSRLYLGVNWLSDVLGGVLIASVLSVLFSLRVATKRLGHYHPLWLLGTSLLVWVLASGVNIGSNFDRMAERFQPVDKITAFALADYVGSGWSTAPGKRINMVGKPREVFTAQWVGSLRELEQVLGEQHFKLWGRWGWRQVFPYLKSDASLSDMDPNPEIHDGLRAKLSATLDDPAQPGTRLVVRAFQSNIVVKGDTAQRVYLINITREALRRDLGLFALPADTADDAAAQGVIQQIEAAPQVETLGQVKQGDLPVALLRPKS